MIDEFMNLFGMYIMGFLMGYFFSLLNTARKKKKRRLLSS